MCTHGYLWRARESIRRQEVREPSRRPQVIQIGEDPRRTRQGNGNGEAANEEKWI